MASGLVGLWLVLLLAGSGCSAIGAIAGKVIGDVPVEAQYTLAKVPTLVLAENYRRLGTAADASDRVAATVTQQLVAKDLAPIIPAEKLTALRDQLGEGYRKLDVVAVARRLGAEQVLYIDMQALGVSVGSESELLKGESAAFVRVIDVSAGQVVYPLDATDGQPVRFETQVRRPGDKTTRSSIEGDLVAGLSGRIARLFYKWKPDEVENDRG